LPLRGASLRHDARAPVRCDRPPARRQPHLHHPGPDRALRRRGPAHPRRLEQPQAPAAQGAGAREGGGAGMTACGQVECGFWPLCTRRRTSGVVGVLCGSPPLWLATPPIEARTVVWTILVGILAVAFGIWTVSRGEHRLGWGAVAAGVFGIALGI